MSFGAGILYSREKTNGDDVGTAASKPGRVVLLVNRSGPGVYIRDERPTVAIGADLVDLSM
jgi:hypothetical protein